MKRAMTAFDLFEKTFVQLKEKTILAEQRFEFTLNSFSEYYKGKMAEAVNIYSNSSNEELELSKDIVLRVLGGSTIDKAKAKIKQLEKDNIEKLSAAETMVLIVELTELCEALTSYTDVVVDQVAYKNLKIEKSDTSEIGINRITTYLMSLYMLEVFNSYTGSAAYHAELQAAA